MSNFRKRYKQIKMSRFMRQASDDQLAEQFIQMCSEYGLNLTEEDLKAAENTKEGKITPYKLMTAPGVGAAFVESVMAAPTPQAAADMVIDKITEINEKFVGKGFDKWFSGVSDAKLNELRVKLPRMKRRGYTPQQAIGMYIYDGLQAFMGDAVIRTSELEDETKDEIEKITKELVSEFENKVRSLLANLKQI